MLTHHQLSGREVRVGFPRETEPMGCVYTESRFIIRHWLTRFWKPVSPEIFRVSWQVRPRRPDGFVPVSVGRPENQSDGAVPVQRPVGSRPRRANVSV